jgi:type I restriction enzyme S subunit
MIFNASKFNSHWENRKLSELGSFNRGKSKHRPRNDKRLFENGTHPLVQTGEVREANLYIEHHSSAYNDFGLLQSKLWPSNTLCITIAANIAETAILSYPMCFPDSVVGFIAEQESTSELFMHYVFTYIRKAIQNSVQGSIQDNINIDYLTNLKFKIPPKPYQDKILDLLGTLDEKIELNNKINAELEAMAKLIYDYWFVQFDFPDANDKPYKSSGGKMVYNEELKREIPDGWGVNELSEIATIKAGGDKPKVFSSELNSQCAVPIYSNGIKNYGIYGYTEKAKIQEPSITISARGTIGVTFLRMHPFVPIIRLIVVTPCKHVYLKYLDEFLKAIEFENSGSVQMQLTAPQVAQQKVICPSEEVLVKFSSITSDAIDKIELIKNESSELIKLRDWLLPMLMNGQVTVR